MPKFYAHAVVHDHEADVIYQRGDEIGPDVPGFDELVEAGSVKDEPYEPEEQEVELIHETETVVADADEGSGNDSHG
jgi:hypothetical protein